MEQARKGANHMLKVSFPSLERSCSCANVQIFSAESCMQLFQKARIFKHLFTVSKTRSQSYFSRKSARSKEQLLNQTKVIFALKTEYGHLLSTQPPNFQYIRPKIFHNGFKLTFTLKKNPRAFC